jgi:hypothetical protein
VLPAIKMFWKMYYLTKICLLKIDYPPSKTIHQKFNVNKKLELVIGFTSGGWEE